VSPQLDTTNGMQALNAQVGTQASWIGYLNAFHLMMILTIVVIPLIAFARSAKQAEGPKQVAIE